MVGIHHRCVWCNGALLRFPGARPGLVPCPLCHRALEVNGGAIRQVTRGAVLGDAPPRKDVDRTRGRAVEQSDDSPKVGLEATVSGLVTPWRRGAVLSIPVGVAICVIATFVILRVGASRSSSATRFDSDDPAVSLARASATHESLPSYKKNGNPAVNTERREQAGERTPTASVTKKTPDMRSEPIPQSLVDVVRRVAPSVAQIVVSETDGKASGSGFLVHSNRLMVTNFHVISKTSRAIAIQRKPDGSDGIRRMVQGFVACEPLADLVLLALAEEWPSEPLVLAPPPTQPGTDVFAIGSPHGLGGTVTRGIVSSMRKAGELHLDQLAPRTVLVQTDAFFSHGSSGGPLCDSKGRVVGVTAFGIPYENGRIVSDNDIFRFAIAAEEVRQLIQRREKTVRPLAQLPLSSK